MCHEILELKPLSGSLSLKSQDHIKVSLNSEAFWCKVIDVKRDGTVSAVFDNDLLLAPLKCGDEITVHPDPSKTKGWYTANHHKINLNSGGGRNDREAVECIGTVVREPVVSPNKINRSVTQNLISHVM